MGCPCAAAVKRFQINGLLMRKVSENANAALPVAMRTMPSKAYMTCCHRSLSESRCAVHVRLPDTCDTISIQRDTIGA
eukprot:6174412-Pleurochrysis_carterae.AAC.2